MNTKKEFLLVILLLISSHASHSVISGVFNAHLVQSGVQNNCSVLILLVPCDECRLIFCIIAKYVYVFIEVLCGTLYIVYDGSVVLQCAPRSQLDSGHVNEGEALFLCIPQTDVYISMLQDGMFI